MASVIVSATPAQQMLDYALGKKRVSFGELSQAEGDEILRRELYEMDLRELRGFKPLRNLFTYSPGSFVIGSCRTHTLAVQTLFLSETVSFCSDDPSVDLDTQMTRINRDYIHRQNIFKRHETQEETMDPKVARSWGESAYHWQGSAEVLTLRRPRNHTRGDANLFRVALSYEKVPLKDEHAITHLTATKLPFENLRPFLRDQYPRVAVEIIQDIRDAYKSTAGELENQMRMMERRAAELEKLTNALTY